ncbi:MULTISPECIES: EamA family transporter [unclassified Haladaptatus]|uniref:EamA family transporter n=1 Tax=unclassified Haladaptatus TaxID=2622732 RepID=UPI0023E781C3|nr:MULTISPECIES: EamA family transporter [unclassified Haladaptatus]
MNYVWYALLALGSYTLVAPLTKVATQDLSSDVVATITNGMLVVVALGLVVYNDESVIDAVTPANAPYLLGAGICLTVGIIAYYRALALGPVSVVVPIFGMFLVTSSVVGIAFLGESLTARKALGIVLAGVAVYLVTVE